MPRKSWHHATESRHARGYGSKWEKTRLVIIARDMGLCQPCKRRDGRPTPFDQVDHIKPKAQGGTDDHDNLECICEQCHTAKSAAEGQAAMAALRLEGKRHIGIDGWPVEPKQWGYSIPHGMRPASCKVYLVVGPPASGKTTYVQANKGPRDKVIDLDAIKVRIGGKLWDDDESISARALRYRDMMIRGLADETGGAAWLIATAPTKAERGAWLDALGPNAELIEVITDAATCRERIMADPRRAALAPIMLDLVAKWEQ
jgi:5-methylcytosine-specific restriction protein A